MVKLTTTDNYKMWSTAMKITLKGKNKMGFVDGTYVRHVTSLVISQQWERCNNIFLGWILGSLSPELYLGHVYSKIASDVTEKLDPLPDVKDAFNVVSKEESYRELHHRSVWSLDSKLFVGFDEHKCYIQDLNLVKNVGTGNESGGLYLFDVEQYGKCKCGLSNSVFVSHVSKQLWHSRLGHPSDQVLSILSKNIGLKYDKHISPCDICHKTKQTRDPFPLSDHKSDSVGDLVHWDLWGPYKVVSKDGYKYFITVVDDYSRAVWAYFIKTKDEVAFYIESFVELISTHFNKKIKVFRLPSSILFGASPYLLAYGKEPNLSHIKCFGCLCYSIVLNNHDKFSSSPHRVIDEATFATQIDDNNNIFEGSQTENNGSRSGIEFQNSKNNGDEPQTARKSNISETKVFKLVKYLWGRKQALRKWNEKLTNALKENDFKQGINEYSLFVKNDNGIFLALLGYVDDIVVYHGNSLGLLGFSDADWAKCLVSRKFVS
ncbi:ribonuclease H-like domain-containing protein, partial [Tanacetum coccineum]